MTLNELNEHLELIKQKNKAQELLDSFWAKAHPGAQVLDGMPHAPGINDKVGYLAAEIADIQTEIDQLNAMIVESEKEILVFIQNIKDLQLRLIFRFRFLYGKPWKEVADIVGRWSTEDSVRCACYRYLDEQESESLRIELNRCDSACYNMKHRVSS